MSNQPMPIVEEKDDQLPLALGIGGCFIAAAAVAGDAKKAYRAGIVSHLRDRGGATFKFFDSSLT